MAISFNSVGHFFASVYTKVAAGVEKIEGTEKAVETETSTIPVYGELALPVEKLAYATLGEFAAVLSTGDAAVKAKLEDAGLDSKVVSAVEALIASGVQTAALVKAL